MFYIDRRSYYPHYLGVLLTDVDECTNSPCIDGTCVNQPGSYLCLCEPGFTLERNVCIGNIIYITVSCYISLTSALPFTNLIRQSKWKCLPDFDECLISPCINATCVNQIGSFRCECPEGYLARNNSCFGQLISCSCHFQTIHLN